MVVLIYGALMFLKENTIQMKYGAAADSSRYSMDLARSEPIA